MAPPIYIREQYEVVDVEKNSRSERLHGRETTQAGGGSQPEERHNLAAEVHMINRRRKNPVRRVFE
jgi:hypothetical protein